LIDVRRIARDFVVSNLGADEDFFNTAWDFISSNYERLSLASVSYSDLKRISMPLGIAGDEEENRLFAALIFVNGIKQMPISGKVKDLVAVIQAASKRDQAQGKMIKDILNKLNEFNPNELVRGIKPEKKLIKLEAIKDSEGLWYKNLGIKIDCDDKSKVTFHSIDKKAKEVFVKFGVKSFALLVRLAVAMRTHEMTGYVYIHPMPEKIKKCFKECGYRRNEKCLYFDYRGTERFRTLLARKDIFGLSEKEKRNLIWTDKSKEKIKGRVRLAIPAKNIDINIAHIKKFKDRLDPQQGTSPAQKKGIELAKILLGDACKAYDEYLSKSANLPTQKL